MFSSNASSKSEKNGSHGGSGVFGRQNCSDMQKELRRVMTTRCVCLRYTQQPSSLFSPTI